MTKKKGKAKGSTAVLPAVTEAEVMDQVADVFRVLGLTDIHRRNTGGAHYANRDGSTRYVGFGQTGDSDYSGQIPAGTTSDGRPRPALHVDIEVKRPGGWPTEEQIQRLIRTNQNGGIGFWTFDGKQCLHILRRVLDGWTPVVDEKGNLWLDDGKD